METIMRQKFDEKRTYLTQQSWLNPPPNSLRVRFLPDDISHLSWDFIREFKDKFCVEDWEAIMKYHTTHTKEEKEFLQYIQKAIPSYSLEKMQRLRCEVK